MNRILLGFCALAFASPAFGWGCEGHQIVALLARVHLTPVATNSIDELLRANPVNTASNFCKGAGDRMADISSWADTIRNEEKTGPWHYVDIPLGQKHQSSLDPWCEPVGPKVEGKDRSGCVVTAIADNAAIVSDHTKSPAQRAQALRYLIHFIGDMHQPLHTTDNKDQGGNCTSMTFFADARPANLHSIWDTRMVAKRLAENHLSISQYATELDRRFRGNFKKWSQGEAVDWAWDGHAVAEKVVYGDLVPKIPREKAEGPTNCNAERAKVEALHISIGEEYFRKSMPVVDEQLAKAGYRLASFLNRLFTS